MSGMNLTLKIWRQKNNGANGHFENYKVQADEHMSFLEMLDVLALAPWSSMDGLTEVRQVLLPVSYT